MRVFLPPVFICILLLRPKRFYVGSPEQEGFKALDIKKRKEDFNIAVVRSVAASCGWAVGEWSQDMDLIDTTLQKKVSIAGGKTMIATCDFQLKCTASTKLDSEEYISFYLKPDHFNSLKERLFGSPFMLCVMVVPEDTNDWHNLIKESPKQSHFDTLLRHCAYARILHDHENFLDEDNKAVRFYKGRDELSVDNLNRLEALLGSPEYNHEKAKTESKFWSEQLKQ